MAGRRHGVSTLAVLAVLLLLPALASAAPLSGEYVGTNGKVSFAVVAGEPGESGKRKVRVYVCDGRTVAEWFVAPASAKNTLTIRSADGDALARVTLKAKAVSGTVTLADGKKLTLTARPTSGIAGFYTATVTRERARGTSAGGVKVEADLISLGGEVTLVGRFTLPNGDERPYRGEATNITPGAWRWIVLRDGRVHGGKTKMRAGEGGLGFSVPDFLS